MPVIIDSLKVAEKIKSLLKQHNMTQDDLANKLSISKSAVSQNLRGKSTFDLQNLALIAKLFNISLDELLGLKVDESSFVGSEYYKVVEKGLNAINDIPKENLRIFQPDMYGKVLMDYVIEKDEKDIFAFIHDNKIKFVEDNYHRAKEVYLKVIKYMLENDLDDMLEYIISYSNLEGSFEIEDETMSYIIWGLLDQPSMQGLVSKLINYKPSVKSALNNVIRFGKFSPINKPSLINIIGKHKLKNVLITYLNLKIDEISLNDIIPKFVEYGYTEGINYYIDLKINNKSIYIFNDENHNCFLKVLETKNIDTIKRFFDYKLYTNLTEIVTKAIELELNDVVLHLVSFGENLNFKVIGEMLVKKSNIVLIKDMSNRLSQDDLNFLLSKANRENNEMIDFLILLGAKFTEKYYNFSTFDKMNKIIDRFYNKGDK